MTATCFVDTNILVYYRDAGETIKRPIAAQWLDHLWSHRAGRLSVQVLNEYYVTVTRKLKPGMPLATARQDVMRLMTWQPLPVDENVIRHAWRVQDKFGFSWWDSLIVAAASILRCDVLLSEDLQDERALEGFRIINPFLHPHDIKTYLPTKNS
ncbi:MAG: PIN domain-containing protein [Myxococcota bacterium]|nr:PIN domain-containing protein [Myxococcota bacterium]